MEKLMIACYNYSANSGRRIGMNCREDYCYILMSFLQPKKCYCNREATDNIVIVGGVNHEILLL